MKEETMADAAIFVCIMGVVIFYFKILLRHYLGFGLSFEEFMAEKEARKEKKSIFSFQK